MKICVFGAASAHIDDTYIKAVEELGEKLARRGHSLVFGGGANGLMGAVARGVKLGGGKIVAVIPKFFKDEGIELTSSNCNEIIFTETMAERKNMMEKISDAFIVLPGGLGTLEEFFEIYTLLQLGRHQKPLTVFNIDNYYDDMKKFLNKISSKKIITGKCISMCKYFQNVDELFEYIEKYQANDLNWHDLLYGY